MGTEAIGIATFIVLAVVCLTLINMRRYTIYEYERGLLYVRGKFHRTLGPGRYWFFRPTHTVRKVDIRTQFVSVVGQEVLSADNVSIKMSLVASYKISDPHLAINQTVSYQQALYLLLQLCLRDLIGSTPIDELLSKREEIGQQLYEKAVDQAAGLGVELSLVGIKDVMFPGDLKAIFAQVVNARSGRTGTCPWGNRSTPQPGECGQDAGTQPGFDAIAPAASDWRSAGEHGYPDVESG